MSRTNKDTKAGKSKQTRRCGAYGGNIISHKGKFLGYWDESGRCNRSRRNAQKITSHQRRAVLKEHLLKEKWGTNE